MWLEGKAFILREKEKKGDKARLSRAELDGFYAKKGIKRPGAFSVRARLYVGLLPQVSLLAFLFL